MNFITRIKRKTEDQKTEYPFNIPAIQALDALEIESPVTFFIGENGSGKSTLLEALALACGVNPEGGSENFNFSTVDSHSELHRSLILSKTGRRPKTRFFLRAESFYNVVSEIDALQAQDAYGGESLHHCSHGESFMTLIENRFWPNGLYFLDEPESALSPLKQMQLLVLIHDLVKNGSQFFIATHSPILLAFPNARIYDFDHQLLPVNYRDTEVYKLYTLFLAEPDRMLDKLFETDVD